MHPDPTPRARFSPRTTTPAPMARGRIVSERGGRVIGRGAGRKGRLWIQKTPGVQRRQASRFLAHCLTWRQEAANHHEFRLSGQSTPRSQRRQVPRSPVCILSRQMRVDVCCIVCRETPFDRVTFGYRHEVVCSVRGSVVFARRHHSSAPRGRARPHIHFTHRRRSVPYPTTHCSNCTIRSRGDLTVTTRPGVVAFHRSRFSRLASPCSGGGAPCGATHGANFNREAHT
jgi:hypothetical protein